MENLIEGLKLIQAECPNCTVEAFDGFICIDLMNESIDEETWVILVNRLGWVGFSDGFKYYL